MFLKRFFTPREAKPVFSRDLPGDEAALLRAEFDRCLERDGGTLASRRRLEALVELFDNLSDSGRAAYAGVVAGLNDTAAKSAGDRYSRIEESEYFGRSSTKMAILDAFEPPRKRLLMMMSDTPSGPELLDRLRTFGPPDLASEIGELSDGK